MHLPWRIPKKKYFTKYGKIIKDGSRLSDDLTKYNQLTTPVALRIIVGIEEPYPGKKAKRIIFTIKYHASVCITCPK